MFDIDGLYRKGLDRSTIRRARLRIFRSHSSDNKSAIASYVGVFERAALISRQRSKSPVRPYFISRSDERPLSSTHARIIACMKRSTALLLLGAALSVQASPGEMSESARTYLTGVLDTMQKSALNRDSIDWNRVRAETFALAGDAQTTTDTYVAIAHAIGELKERHSTLMLPDNLDKDRKQAIQAQMRAELIKTRGAAAGSSRGRSPFASPNEMAGHLDRRNGRVLAHVVVPHC